MKQLATCLDRINSPPMSYFHTHVALMLPTSSLSCLLESHMAAAWCWWITMAKQLGPTEGIQVQCPNIIEGSPAWDQKLCISSPKMQSPPFLTRFVSYLECMPSFPLITEASVPTEKDNRILIEASTYALMIRTSWPPPNDMNLKVDVMCKLQRVQLDANPRCHPMPLQFNFLSFSSIISSVQ